MPLDVYNGSSQVYRFKPEGRIHKCCTLINFLNNWYIPHSFFILLGIANVNWVFNISNKYLFGCFVVL